MYCRYCREKIEDNDTTCKSCGSNLIVEKTNKYKYCKYCYTKNKEDAKYYDNGWKTGSKKTE